MFVDLKFSIFKIQVSDYMNSKKKFSFSVLSVWFSSRYTWFNWTYFLLVWMGYYFAMKTNFSDIMPVSKVLTARPDCYLVNFCLESFWPLPFCTNIVKVIFKTTSTKPFPSHVLWCPSTSNTRVVVILPYCGVLNLNNLFDAAVTGGRETVPSFISSVHSL